MTVNNISKLLRITIFLIIFFNSQSSFSIISSVSRYPEFTIIDNIAYWNTFRGKIEYLDFSIEKICDTRLFLVACGLQSQFISQLIKSRTNVEGRILNNNII